MGEAGFDVIIIRRREAKTSIFMHPLAGSQNIRKYGPVVNRYFSFELLNGSQKRADLTTLVQTPMVANSNIFLKIKPQ